MAAKKQHVLKFSLQEAVDFCLNSDNSDCDSSVGGLSSGEEEEINDLLLNLDSEIVENNYSQASKPFGSNNDSDKSDFEIETECLPNIKFCTDTDISQVVQSDTLFTPKSSMNTLPFPSKPAPKKLPSKIPATAKRRKRISQTTTYKSYDDIDQPSITIPYFTPNRPPGCHIPPNQHTRTAFTKPLHFFQLFFTAEIIQNIVQHTNMYAYLHLEEKKVYREEISGNNTSVYLCNHVPEFTDVKKQCAVCYKKEKKQYKVRSCCQSPYCNVYLHVTTDKNCFKEWHTAEFHRKYQC